MGRIISWLVLAVTRVFTLIEKYRIRKALTAEAEKAETSRREKVAAEIAEIGRETDRQVTEDHRKAAQDALEILKRRFGSRKL